MEGSGKPHNALNRVLFSSDLVEIGLFDCPRHHPLFHDSGPISHYLVVFPRRAVKIQHTGQQAVVASRQVITLYNNGQEYRREGLSDYGDQSVWLRFRKPEVVEALYAAGRAHAAAERVPFAWTHGACDPQTYLLQRQLLRGLMTPAPGEFLFIAETAMRLLQRAVAGTSERAIRCRQTARTRNTLERHRRLALRCESLLTIGYREPLTLESIAAELATTPFHLSRVFSGQTGKSIHQYLLQLRLRAAVDRMIDRPRDRITDIGLETGFATPSHFAQAFRKAFGVTPRRFRLA